MNEATTAKSTPPPKAGTERSTIVLMTIGGFKLLGGLLLFAAGFGIFRLLGKDLGVEFEDFVRRIHIDPEHRVIQLVGEKLAGISPARLKAIGAGTFFYAILESSEGIGLLMRKRWAEYLTVIATASLLPLELFEIARKVSAIRLLVLAINVAVLVYLVVQLYRTKKSADSGGEGPEDAGRS